MADSSSIAAKFFEAMTNSAAEKCRLLEEEAKAETAAEMERAESLIRAKCSEKMENEIKKIKKNTVNRLSACRNQAKAALAKKRKELEDAVFEEAAQKLLDFSRSDEYAAFLLNSAEAARQIVGGGGLVFLLRPADLCFREQLAALFPGCSFAEDKNNTLGGITVKSDARRLVLDNTLSSRLAAQRRTFREQAGMKIV